MDTLGLAEQVTYELVWMGIPIIQLPEDILMMQELIWRVRPDVIIESGVAHGGALILYASLLEAIGRARSWESISKFASTTASRSRRTR